MLDSEGCPERYNSVDSCPDESAQFSEPPHVQVALLDSPINNVQEKQKRTNIDVQPSVCRMRKNVVVLGIVFFVHFTAFDGLGMLQSSLHIDQGLGVVTQAIVYAVFSLSSLFLPKLMISRLGHKWTLTFSLIGYIPWMATNGYAVWFSMVPASFLVGLTAAPLWTAKSSYLAILSSEYARITGQNTASVLAAFCGIFYGIFRCACVVGAIISSTVLNYKPENQTKLDNNDSTEMCGTRDCPWNNHTNIYFEKTLDSLVWTLVGIYVSIAVVGVIISIVFLDPLPEYLTRETKSRNPKKEILKQFGATTRHMRHVNQRLLIPITIYAGMQQAFIMADFNKSWVTCILGIWWVGWITIPLYVFCSLGSVVTGRLVKRIGRLPNIISGAVLDLTVYVVLLFWDPHPDVIYVFFIVSVLWGISIAIWQTQVTALYGVLFPNDNEAAYSNLHLYNSIGFTLAFSYNAFLCTSVKLYIVISLFVAGMIGYFAVEINEFKKKEKKSEKAEAIELNSKPVFEEPCG